jgi:hypothetical protein
LRAEQQPFTLILRTFGPDAQEIAKVLNESEIGCDIKTFHRIKRGVFKIDDKEANLHEYIKQFSQKPGEHLAIRDHHKWWFKHGECYQFGKAFPIDLNDPDALSIFFDDNAAFKQDRPEHNIVNPYDPVTRTSLSIKDLIERRRLFPVDTLKAILDENYFIDLVKEAILTHSRC